MHPADDSPSDKKGLDRSDLAAIALGGILGASARWGIRRLLTDLDRPRTGWFGVGPSWSHRIGVDTVAELTHGMDFSMLLINLIGCLLLGGLTVLLATAVSRRRLLIAAASGFCGSLTSFSTFAVWVALMVRNKHGVSPSTVDFPFPWLSIVVYVLASVFGGAVAFWLGRAGAHRMDPPRDLQLSDVAS